MTLEKRWLLWIVALGLALRLIVWYWLLDPIRLVTLRMPDDALYYFTIACNLAHGYGISFDAAHPTNGMHPLWLFVITPFFAGMGTKWGAIHAVLLLQSLLDVGIIWLIGNTVYRLLPFANSSNRTSAAAIAAFLYAANLPNIFHSINGLETTLAAFLLLAWLQAYMELNANPKRGILFGLVTGLLLLARTDLFIVLIPLAIYVVSRKRDRIKSSWLIPALVTAFLIILPWFVWNIIQFGTPLQSSAEAVPIFAMKKYAAIYGSPFSIYTHLAIDAFRNCLKPFWYAGLGLPLVTVLFAILWRKTLYEGERIAYFLAIGGILLLAIHTLFRGFIRDWYVEELIPLFLIGFGISIAANAGKSNVRVSGRWLLASVIVVAQFFILRKDPMLSQRVMLSSGVPIVEQLTKTEKVAAFNSGYYSYFASRPGSVIDMDGVVSSEAVEAIKHGNLRRYLERDSVSYILDFQGDFGGYINLIDRYLLDDFTMQTKIVDPSSPSNPLLLYRRKGTEVK